MKTTNFDFMGKRYFAATFSGVLLLVAVLGLSVNSLNFGLDFTGGTLVELGFPEKVDAQVLRENLESTGFENGTVQFFGSDRDILIRMPPQDGSDQASLGDQLFQTLAELYPGVQLRQSNFVGPAVGRRINRRRWPCAADGFNCCHALHFSALYKAIFNRRGSGAYPRRDCCAGMFCSFSMDV